MYGISRIDYDLRHSHAWRVSFSRRGKRYVKNFPDKKHGGKTKALKLAKEYRDQFVRENPPLSRREFCSILRAHNTSGINGVYRYAKPYRVKNGEIRESWYWEATWPQAGGIQAHMAFSVNEFGESVARKLAIRMRERKIAEIEGVFWASERGDMHDRRKPSGQRHGRLLAA